MRRGTIGGGLGMLAIAAGALIALPHDAHAAANISVDQTNDLGAAGVCPSVNPALPTCDLRAAIRSSASGDTLVLHAGTYTLQVPPLAGDDINSGDLNISHALTIRGAGAASTAISAAVALEDRIISATSAGPLTLSGLTLEGGASGANANDGNCASGRCSGGAVFSTVPLIVTDVDFSNNVANENGGGVFVAAAGGSSFTRVRFLDNHALGQQLVDVGGGGVYDDIAGSCLSRGQRDVAAQPSLDTYTDVVFEGNSAANMNGGGAYFESECNDASASIVTRAQFDNNSAARMGGAIYTANSGGTSISDSTITNNTATVHGAAVAVLVVAADAFQLNNDTINGNHGPEALYATNSQKVGLANTILYANGPSGGPVRECTFASNTSIPFNGYVLSDTAASECHLTTTASAHNQPDGANPNLGALANNGGFVKTEALQSGSPALNTGNPSTPNNDPNYSTSHYTSSSPPPCLSSDARGTARPQGAACDLGAYEAVVTAPTPTPTPIPVPPTGAVEQPLTPAAPLIGAAFVLASAAFAVTRRRTAHRR